MAPLGVADEFLPFDVVAQEQPAPNPADRADLARVVDAADVRLGGAVRFHDAGNPKAFPERFPDIRPQADAEHPAQVVRAVLGIRGPVEQEPAQFPDVDHPHGVVAAHVVPEPRCREPAGDGDRTPAAHRHHHRAHATRSVVEGQGAVHHLTLAKAEDGAGQAAERQLLVAHVRRLGQARGARRVDVEHRVAATDRGPLRRVRVGLRLFRQGLRDVLDAGQIQVPGTLLRQHVDREVGERILRQVGRALSRGARGACPS